MSLLTPLINSFKDELTKIAQKTAGLSPAMAKTLMTAGAGSALTLAAIRAKNDIQMAEQFRRQQ